MSCLTGYGLKDVSSASRSIPGRVISTIVVDPSLLAAQNGWGSITIDVMVSVSAYPFATYNKSVADDFENILFKMWKNSIHGSFIIR